MKKEFGFVVVLLCGMFAASFAQAEETVASCNDTIHGGRCTDNAEKKEAENKDNDKLPTDSEAYECLWIGSSNRVA